MGSVRTGDVIGVVVADAGRDEVFDGVEVLDAAACTDGHAVEGGGGAGEVELAVERPALKEAVDEAGVEDVSGSGGIDYVHSIGWGVVELHAIPGEDTFFTEGRGGEETAVAALHQLEGFFEVGLGHETAGEVSTDDEVVDVLEEFFDAGVDLVEVGDDGNVGFAGPAGCESCCGGVVAVDVEGAGVDDPVSVEFGGLEDETLVAAAEDGALAAAVDQDERLGADAGDSNDLGLDAGAGEGFAVESGGVVVAELAYVAGAHSPVLTGDYGACNLASGKEAGGAVFDLGASRWEV